MPNTREKLIELLGAVQYQGNAVHGYHDKYVLNGELADHLIANGVTFATDNNVGDKLTPTAEWIPVSERLPGVTGRYLTANIRADDERCVFDLWFDCGEWYIDEEDDKFIYKVTHWMPLPNPPKGE